MKQIVLLAGDGIGPEIMVQAERVLQLLKNEGVALTWQHALIGGVAIDQCHNPLPTETLHAAKAADAVLLAAVGGPKWDQNPRELRPEKGLLALRKQLDLFANLRPIIVYPQLAHASSLKEEVVTGLDMMIVRELTGGIYFGEPRGIHEQDGQRVGINTLRYESREIKRIAQVAFEIAEQRNKRVCSVDKMNVLESSQLWREEVEYVGQNFAEIHLSHMLVDNAAMQLVKNPQQFDVLLTGNMFGDILSDEAAMLTGSIGMLPSASLGAGQHGVYEPCHGSAPDIAGQDRANPLAMILSLAMMLRYSCALPEIAERIEHAVQDVLSQGLRTDDLMEPDCQRVGCHAMGDAVLAALA